MGRRLFDPESLVWKPLGTLGDFVTLSLLWALCCVPVLTVGASTTALYDTAVHALRRKDDRLLSRFFSTFKQELKTGALSTLLWAAILAVEFFLGLMLRPDSVIGNAVLSFARVLVPFFTLCILAWVFPTLSRFTFGTLALNATALRLALGHILRSVALALLIGCAGYVFLRYVLAVIVLPGLVAFLSTYLIEPVFLRYEHPKDETEPPGDS